MTLVGQSAPADRQHSRRLLNDLTARQLISERQTIQPAPTHEQTQSDELPAAGAGVFIVGSGGRRVRTLMGSRPVRTKRHDMGDRRVSGMTRIDLT